MFEVVQAFMIDFIYFLPVLIPFILVINLICSMLWGD